MVKRTIETSVLMDPFFLALDAKLKLAWLYLLLKADVNCVVIVVPDYDNFVLKYPIKWEELIGKCGDRLVQLGDSRYFIPSLIETAYGKLSSKCRPHAAIIEGLRKHGVPEEVIASVCRPVVESPINPMPPVPEPVQNPLRATADSIAESVPSEKQSKPRARFVPPTLEEVKDYCTARSNSVDPQAFLDHYETCGWKQGKGKPVTDWRAAVRTWEHMAKKSEAGKPSPERRKIIEQEELARTREQLSKREPLRPTLSARLSGAVG